MGFEWSTIVEREKGKAACAAADELRAWAENPWTPEVLGYFGSELSAIWLFLPERANDIWFESKRGEGEVTFKQHFGKNWPGDGDALLWALDLPWLWKVPPSVKAKAAECFAKHGVLDVWRTIVEDGKRISDQAFEAVIRAFGQLQEDVRVVKVMNRWLSQ
jgi:hypothetical protein